LGFSVLAEQPSKPVDRALLPLARKLMRRPHLALLVELEEDVKRHYRHDTEPWLSNR